MNSSEILVNIYGEFINKTCCSCQEQTAKPRFVLVIIKYSVELYRISGRANNVYLETIYHEKEEEYMFE
jgi:hypothetical protein